MRKYLVLFLAVSLVALFAGSSISWSKAKTEKAKGTVKTIDAAKGEMVVTNESGTDMTFKIKKTQAKGMKEGDMVTVYYTKKGEEMTARRVTKMKMKKGMEKSKTPAGSETQKQY